jgi:hypothetical protein
MGRLLPNFLAIGVALVGSAISIRLEAAESVWSASILVAWNLILLIGAIVFLFRTG